MFRSECMEQNNLENKFISSVNEGKLNINSIEDMMLEEFEEYQENLINHMEELLLKKVDEKDLDSKKRIKSLIKELRKRMKYLKH